MTILPFTPNDQQPHTDAMLLCGRCGKAARHVFLSRLSVSDLECVCGQVGMLRVMREDETIPPGSYATVQEDL